MSDRPEVELRQLRALVAVVDEGTFTDAAIALGTTQASVSRAVAALEQALGVRVLARTTRRVEPTEAGAVVLRHARRALGAVAALRRSAATAGDHVRVGYTWVALGRHTNPVQARWAREHPGSEVVFVQTRSRTAGLSEGGVEAAVLRTDPGDRRIETAQVGTETRLAALAAGDPLARRRRVRLRDLADRTVALDALIGTTTRDLWPAAAAPAFRMVQGTDEWLTLIAAGQACGLTAEATAAQYPWPGIRYRPVEDAPPLPVLLAWWRAGPPAWLDDLLAVVRAAYAGG